MINNAQIKLHSWAKQSKAQRNFAVIRKENWEIGKRQDKRRIKKSPKAFGDIKIKMKVS